MSDEDDGLRRRLLPIFKEEATERIAAMAEGFGAFGSSAGEERASLIESAFREAHSLKAAAGAVGCEEIERVCQSMESVLSVLKGDAAALSPTLTAALQRAADALQDFLAEIDSPSSQRQRARAAEVTNALAASLADMRTPPVAEARPPTAPEPPAEDAEAERGRPVLAQGSASETVRVAIQKLNALLLQAEALSAEKLAARQLAAELKATAGIFSDLRREFGKASAVASALTSPEALSPFHERTGMAMQMLEARLLAIGKVAAADSRGLASKVDRLLYDMKQILTLPCMLVFQLFPRVVRELAEAQGKDIRLDVRGGELQVDRNILEELKDPLLHLVRNSIDHGIETPQERSALGKTAQAIIMLSAAAVGSDRVEFVVADDGAGIAAEKVAAAAARLRIQPEGSAAQSKEELLALIFRSGFSTSTVVTDLSGRGLGLAIVREKVEHLGGTLSVESEAGHGTTFRLVVPLTLATYRGVEVRVDDWRLVLPTLGVERVIGVDRAAVTTIAGRATVAIGGAHVPLVRLRDVLELPAAPAGRSECDRLVAAVLGAGPERVAFEVDAVGASQEMLVKPLGKCLARVRNLQGATILAGGAIALVLNVHDLLRSATKVVRRGRPDLAAGEGAAPRPASILVADDSITERVLLKDVLEMAGYRVKTAVDGMDAWTMLASEPFDMLVSDVEMPRLNGLELTARIRAHKTLADLPVVLVTALASSEDRERGVEAGANAYIFKGGFDQAVLLETVRRFA